MRHCLIGKGKRLHLNDRGRQLLPMVGTLQRQHQEIEMFLVESLRKPCGILHVGASTTIGNCFMPGLITLFSQRYPEAKVLLQVGNAAQIEAGVISGDLDLGLSEGFQMNVIVRYYFRPFASAFSIIIAISNGGIFLNSPCFR